MCRFVRPARTALAHSAENDSERKFNVDPARLGADALIRLVAPAPLHGPSSMRSRTYLSAPPHRRRKRGHVALPDGPIVKLDEHPVR